MTDRPKLDAAEVESVRRWAKRESPSGSWDVRLDRVLDLALQALAQQWVSVDERLPDREGRYLTINEEGSYWCDAWSPLHNWTGALKITHWMPLPAPPTGSKL